MSLAFVVYFSFVASIPRVLSACLLHDAISKEWALPGAVTLEGECAGNKYPLEEVFEAIEETQKVARGGKVLLQC